MGKRTILGLAAIGVAMFFPGAEAGAVPIGGFPPPPPVMSANFVVAIQAPTVQARVSADGSGATTLSLWGTATVTAHDGTNRPMAGADTLVWSTSNAAFLPTLQACAALAGAADSSHQPYLYVNVVLPSAVRVAGGTGSAILVPATMQPTSVSCALQF